MQVVLTLRHLHACFVASTSHPSFGIQASNFHHIKPPLRAVVAGFVASKLRNPSLELRLHQTSMPASSHQHSIQALEFVASKLQLRRIHLTSKHLYLVSKLRNPSFDFRSQLQSMRLQRHGLQVCVKYMYREQWPLTWRPRPLSLGARARFHLERAPALLLVPL